MGFLVSLSKTPASFQSFRFSGQISRKLSLSSSCTRFFLHFNDSNKIYGPFRPFHRGKSTGISGPLHRRGLPVPSGFYIPVGRRFSRLSEKQEEMLLSDLASVNRRKDIPDIVHLDLSGGILTVQVAGFSPGPEVRYFRYPVDLAGLKKTSDDILAALNDLCLSRRGHAAKSEERLRTAGALLYRRLFKPSGLAEYFHAKMDCPVSFFLPPELFFLPLECAVHDDFFSLSFITSRLTARHDPVSKHAFHGIGGFSVVFAPAPSGSSFCRKESDLLAGLFRRANRSASFICATKHSFETVYSSSGQFHFAGHGTSKKGRFLWQSENRGLTMDPSAEACAAVPEFIFSSTCNPVFFSRDFSGFLSGLFASGLKAWVGPMTEIRRESPALIECFYRRLLRGVSCGESLLAARRESRENGYCDWPAFGLCGDPFFGLRPEKNMKT
jgi:hypothetical protein